MLKLEIIFGTSLSVLLITFAMAAFYAHPVAAQTASKLKCKGCVKSKQLKNNGIQSKDLKPTISLGTSSQDGGFGVKDTTGAETVSLDGGLGTVSNSFSGDGVVKAWARINADGTVAACYRCNLDPAETRLLITGIYEVDFTPLGTDVSSRPRLMVPDGPSSFATAFSMLGPGVGTDLSAISLAIYDVLAGKNLNSPFTVVVF